MKLKNVYSIYSFRENREYLLICQRAQPSSESITLHNVIWTVVDKREKNAFNLTKLIEFGQARRELLVFKWAKLWSFSNHFILREEKRKRRIDLQYYKQ